MISKEQIVKRMVNFMNKKLDELSINSPMIMVFRPVFHKIIDKVSLKADKCLSFLADENGMIDIAQLMDEIVNNLVTAKAKEYPDVLSGITIGDGKIIINIPFVDKQLVLEKSDIDELKNFIIR